LIATWSTLLYNKHANYWRLQIIGVYKLLAFTFEAQMRKHKRTKIVMKSYCVRKKFGEKIEYDKIKKKVFRKLKIQA